MMIGIFLWCTAAFWGWCFGELPRSMEYVFREEFWMYRGYNLSDGDKTKALYIGYGMGFMPFVILPIVAFLWLF